MDDLISRAAAIDAIVSVTAFPDEEYIKNLCENPANSEDWLGGVCAAINAVEEVNAVDAAPVVHSRWKQTDAYPHWLYCLNCYKRIVPNAEWIDEYNIPTNYCPNCGAKMIGDDNG